jgi:hypothetical protein
MSLTEKDHDRTQGEIKDKVRKSAFWFFAIAGLSIINTILLTRGVYFVLGLATSQLLDSYFIGVTGKPNLLLSLIPPAIFCLLGFFGLRLNRWAFISALILYFIDSIIYALLTEWIALAFHAFILYQLYLGIVAMNEYKKLSTKA